MKILGLAFIGVAVLLIILGFIFSDPAYGPADLGIMSNSIPIVAAFLIGAGLGLFLAGFNIERQDKRRRSHGDRKNL